jgi:DNA-binding transcriptional LysR family regulator
VELAANEHLIDIAAEGFDAGVRLGQIIAADMIAVRLTPPFPFVVVGSPITCAAANAPNESMTCASMRACVCAVRMGQSRPGLLSTAIRPSR